MAGAAIDADIGDLAGDRFVEHRTVPNSALVKVLRGMLDDHAERTTDLWSVGQAPEIALPSG